MVLLPPPQTLNKLIMLTRPGEEIWHGIIIINLINLKRNISSAKPSNQNLFEIVKQSRTGGITRPVLLAINADSRIVKGEF